MHAVHTPTYGAPHVLELREVAAPQPGPGEVVVDVIASPVTAGDRRLRSADFPGFTALPGRLAIGMTGPRRAVQGTMFSGRIRALGEGVTEWSVGDAVFGAVDYGAWAEQLVVAADAVVAVPAGVSFPDAAAVPYGAGTSLYFLRDLADVQPGERVLILGAAGGVGRYAVQVAKHLGASVTAVGRSEQFDTLRQLGADELLDYRTDEPGAGGQRYDVVFDIAGASSFRQARPLLTDTGRYLTVYMSLDVLFWMAWTALTGGPRALTGVALDNDLATIAAMMADGTLRARVVQRFTGLAAVADAHRAAAVEREGEVVIDIAPAASLRAVG